jgi:hypothetical protein
MAKRCKYGVNKTTGKCLKAKRRNPPIISDAKHYSDLARRIREAKRRDRAQNATPVAWSRWPVPSIISDAKRSDLARRIREAKRRDREGLSGGLFADQVSPWVASAAALAGGILVFNLVKLADPNADTR